MIMHAYNCLFPGYVYGYGATIQSPVGRLGFLSQTNYFFTLGFVVRWKFQIL